MRNLLLFLIGMLILTALLSLSPLVDSVTAGITVRYFGVLLRVGFADFHLGNVSSLDERNEQRGRWRRLSSRPRRGQGRRHE